MNFTKKYLLYCLLPSHSYMLVDRNETIFLEHKERFYRTKLGITILSLLTISQFHHELLTSSMFDN